MSIMADFERIAQDQSRRLSVLCECGCPDYCHDNGTASLCRGCNPCMKLRVDASTRLPYDGPAASSWKAAKT